MIKDFTITIVAAILIAASYFAVFILGMYQAPERDKYNERDHVQRICDESRRKPWKTEIEASCGYLQQYWVIEYKCDELIGCHAYDRKPADG